LRSRLWERGYEWSRLWSRSCVQAVRSRPRTHTQKSGTMRSGLERKQFARVLSSAYGSPCKSAIFNRQGQSQRTESRIASDYRRGCQRVAIGARLGAPPRAGQPSGCDPEGLAELTTGIGSDSPRIAGSRGEREVKSGAGERRAGDDSRAMLHRATEISAGNSALRESDSHAQRGAYARPVNLATDPSVRFASMVGFLLAKQL
jgi:hypothetical protein